ncbi:MAG: peptidoglycan DD-metalloendopeptidase family protein [Bacilli bacterium]|nr:peptidoglycan DD-metalloendopeptidase family protein [Bacilli bacterium]
MTSHVLESVNEAISNDYSAYHKAVDIVGQGNTIDDVVAISDGIVEMVVKDVKYTNHNTEGADTYGNFVKLKHENGKKSLYAHLKYGSVNVSEGESISKGEKIGTMGQTGNAYGTHLHFEVRDSNESRENPNDYLNGSKTLDAAKEIPQNNTEVHENNISDEKTSARNDNTSFKDTVTGYTKEIGKSGENDTSNTTYTTGAFLENSNYQGGSIVDGLKNIGIDSSYDHRCEIAIKNGIQNYHGTYDQNVYLLKLLKLGKLKS